MSGRERTRRGVRSEDHGALDPGKLARAGVFRGLDHHGERVGDSGKQTRSHDLLVDESEQSLLQGQKVPGEIAAVHAGDIVRPQRLQRLRVVPVEEMAAMALQGIHGVQGIGRAFDESPSRQVTEVVSGQVCQQ